MRPWKAVVARTVVGRVGGFNGATTLRPWKADCPSGQSTGPLASMGPRPCGRGRTHARGRTGRTRQASMGPRPCGRGRCRLSRSFGRPLCSFNGATTLRPWKAAMTCYPQARPSFGFNGATTLRPWKGGMTWMIWSGKRSASMGPRPCGRGRREPLADPANASPLQWGHDLAAVEGVALARARWGPPGFNGATTLRPWKATRP